MFFLKNMNMSIISKVLLFINSEREHLKEKTSQSQIRIQGKREVESAILSTQLTVKLANLHALIINWIEADNHIKRI